MMTRMALRTDAGWTMKLFQARPTGTRPGARRTMGGGETAWPRSSGHQVAATGSAAVASTAGAAAGALPSRMPIDSSQRLMLR